jgi:hypothetical protein
MNALNAMRSGRKNHTRKEIPMSRSNYDKPFFVDVGTSIVAIRCASNRDVIFEYDHGRCPHVLKIAKDVCERMNMEAEIGKPLRNCDVGTPEEQGMRMAKFCREQYKKTDGVSLCSSCPFHNNEGLECQFEWAQMPYESEVK